MRALALAAGAALLVLASGAAAASVGDAPPSVRLVAGWQYAWSDAATPPVDAAWRDFSPRLPPPARDGRRIVWYRVPLPALASEAETLFLPGVYQLVQVFAASGERLYAYGEFDGAGAARYLGTPLHLVPLPRALAGQHVYLRIFSEFKNIGLMGDAYVGRAEAHHAYLVRKDLHRVVLGCLLMLLGAFQLFLFRRRDGTFGAHLAFGLFAFTFGLHSLARTQLKELVWSAPLAWKVIEIVTVAATPIGLLVFIERVFGAGPRRVVRRIWQFNVAVLVVVTPMAGLDVGLLEQGLSLFHGSFAPCAAILVAATLWVALKGKGDARLFAAGTAALAIPGAFDGLVVGGTLPWVDPIAPLGALAFLAAQQLILSRRLHAERRRKFELERELETAGILASTFLPPQHARTDRYGIEVVFKPAAEIGGDWFAYYLYADRYLHVHIGDVTGHGPGAALLAAFAKGATDMLYAKLASDRDPAVPLEQLHANLNRLLSGRAGPSRALMTLFSVAIDLETGRMEYINSGHLIQFVCSTSHLRNAILTGHGRTLLGASAKTVVMRPDRLALQGDESIFMFSDGLVEATFRNDGRGHKHVFEELKRAAGLPVEEVRERIVRLIDERAVRGHAPKRADDITFIVIRVKLGAGKKTDVV